MVAEPIESDDLILTPLQVDDADAMVAVLQDRELYVFTGDEPPTVEELRERYARQVRGGSPDGSQCWLNWIVRVSGVPAGYVQATVPLEEGRAVAELAWVIGIRWQGQGLATRSARMVHTWLQDRGVDQFSASINPEHAASAGVATRLGMRRSESITDEGERIWQLP